MGKKYNISGNKVLSVEVNALNRFVIAVSKDKWQWEPFIQNDKYTCYVFFADAQAALDTYAAEHELEAI